MKLGQLLLTVTLGAGLSLAANAQVTIGLEANCNDLLGMLSGLKYDSDGVSQQAALNLIEGAIKGAQAR